MWQVTGSTKKKSVTLLYTKNREAEREFRKSILKQNVDLLWN